MDRQSGSRANSSSQTAGCANRSHGDLLRLFQQGELALLLNLQGQYTQFDGWVDVAAACGFQTAPMQPWPCGFQRATCLKTLVKVPRVSADSRFCRVLAA